MRYGDAIWAQPTPFRQPWRLPGASQPVGLAGRPDPHRRQASQGAQLVRLHRPGDPQGSAAAAGTVSDTRGCFTESDGLGRENQALSGLADRPIRWLVDDTLKFVRREVRREAHYDGLIIDPPKFGRGPKGELWKLEESLPELLDACRSLLDRTGRGSSS